MEQLKKTSKVKKTESTTVHNSKVKPFQIVQVTTTNEETQEETSKFMIGACGQFVSEKEFKSLENAEKYIATRPWELIINLNYITIKLIQEHEESKSNR